MALQSMESPLSSPTREIDVAFLVFVERYATDLIKWDILTFFARDPNFRAPASKIATRLRRSIHSLRPELGDLALLGILNQTRSQNGQTLYQLTDDPNLRKMALKFAAQMATWPPH
jgi:hypothetical protein